MKKIELSSEAADHITVCTLLHYSSLIKKEIKRLEKKFPIADHIALDINHYRNTLEAMKVTMKYFEGI